MSDPMISVAVTWEDDVLLWSRSDAPGAHRWTDPFPNSIGDALDIIVESCGPSMILGRYVSVFTGTAILRLVEDVESGAEAPPVIYDMGWIDES